jgi:hypothetical protein
LSTALAAISLVDSFLADDISMASLYEEISTMVWNSTEEGSVGSDVLLNLIDFINEEISVEQLRTNLSKISNAIKASSAASWGESSIYQVGTYSYFFRNFGNTTNGTASMDADESNSELLSA